MRAFSGGLYFELERKDGQMVIERICEFRGEVDNFGAVKSMEIMAFEDDVDLYISLFEGNEDEFPILPIEYEVDKDGMHFRHELHPDGFVSVDFQSVKVPQEDGGGIDESNRQLLEEATQHIQRLYSCCRRGQALVLEGQTMIFLDNGVRDKLLSKETNPFPDGLRASSKRRREASTFIQITLGLFSQPQSREDTLTLKVLVDTEGFIIISDDQSGIYERSCFGRRISERFPFAIDKSGSILSSRKVSERIDVFIDLGSWNISSDIGFTSWHSDFARKCQWQCLHIEKIADLVV